MIRDLAKSLLKARASNRGVVLRDNWATVLTGDVEGDVVVANGEHHAFALHIPAVRHPVPENVGSLLNWRSRIPNKLHGRDSEFSDLLNWCRSPADIRVRILWGDGGTGKSRLAFELAETLRAEGWQTGQLLDPSHTTAFPIFEPGILLIIDYPEQFPAAVERILCLIKNGEFRNFRLRILLLSRNGEAMRALVDRHAEPWRSPALELRPLNAQGVAWSLFQEGMRQMANLLKSPTTPQLSPADFESWLQRDPAHARPLIILGFALNLIHDPTATQLGGAAILQRLVEREVARLTKEAADQGLQPEGLILLKALTAIPGHLNAASIDLLPTQVNHPGIKLPTTVELQRTTLWHADALTEMQPDVLASVLIHKVLKDWLPSAQVAAPWVWSVLESADPSKEEARARLSRIARLSADRPLEGGQIVYRNSLVDALAHVVERDDVKAKWIQTVLRLGSRVEWTLLPLALSSVRRLVDIYEPRAQLDFATYGATLAWCLAELSLRLHQSGEREQGITLNRRALVLYEQLAQQDFAAYAPNLAWGFNNLSVALVRSGELAEGMAAIHRAVDINERLAQQDFAAHASRFAGSLDNLSHALASSGEHAQALDASRRAVEIHERLRQEGITIHAPAFAMSLSNLSLRLGESGEYAQGLLAIRRSSEIYEHLAQESSAVFAPELAVCLDNLSLRLADAGELPQALTANLRALSIHERLAQENFSGQAPQLALCLNNLSVRLAEAGENEQGLAVIRRSVEIYEELTQKNFAGYGSELAMSLSNLSVRLANAKQRTEALAANSRSLEIRERLAQDNFAAHASGLASTLNNQSLWLAWIGENAKGLAASRRAVEICERLTQENYGAHAPQLAQSLVNISLRLAETGESANGLVAIRRAVEIYESLARESFATHGSDLADSLRRWAKQIVKVSDIPELQGGSLFERALDLVHTNAMQGAALRVDEELMQRARQKLRADDDEDRASGRTISPASSQERVNRSRGYRRP
jgi:tetratricopeptide (TPR) repeat protein